MNFHIKVQHCSEHHSNQCLPVCLLHLLRSPSPSPGPQEFFDHDQVGGIATRLQLYVGLNEQKNRVWTVWMRICLQTIHEKPVQGQG